MPDPVITETGGSTTTVNSDVRVRIWVAQIPQDGVYDIDTGGNVNGYINPQLAFGRASSPDWLLWVFGGLFAAGVARAHLRAVVAGALSQEARSRCALR